MRPGATTATSSCTECTAPKLFLSGDHDEFGPREALTAVWESAPEPKRLVWIAGADHFFQGTADSPGAKLGQHAG